MGIPAERQGNIISDRGMLMVGAVLSFG